MPADTDDAFNLVLETMDSMRSQISDMAESKDDIDVKEDTASHVAVPVKEVNPNLTSNEKLRISRIGSFLFNGGIDPLKIAFEDIYKNTDKSDTNKQEVPMQEQIKDSAPSVPPSVYSMPDRPNIAGEVLAGMQPIADNLNPPEPPVINPPQVNVPPVNVNPPNVNTTVNVPPINVNPPNVNTTVNVPPVNVNPAPVNVQPPNVNPAPVNITNNVPRQEPAPIPQINIPGEKPVSANITSNERARFQRIGEALFTGGMKPLSSLRSANVTAAKMTPTKPKLNIGQMMGNFIGKMFARLARMFNIPMLIMALIEAVPEIIAAVWNTLKKWLMPLILMVTALAGLFSNDKFSEKLKGWLMDGFSQLPKLWWEGIKLYYKVLWNVGKKIIEWIIKGYAEYLKWLFGLYGKLWNYIVDAFKAYWNWVIKLPERAWDAITNLYDRLAAYIKDKVRELLYDFASSLSNLPFIGKMISSNLPANISSSPASSSNKNEKLSYVPKSLTTTENNSNITNINNSSSINNGRSNNSMVQNANAPVIVQATTQTPTVNVGVNADKVQHELARKQIDTMELMNENLAKIVEKPVSGGDTNNTYVVSSGDGSTVTTGSATIYRNENNTYNKTLLQGSRQT